jgi:hypothetical protein
MQPQALAVLGELEFGGPGQDAEAARKPTAIPAPMTWLIRTASRAPGAIALPTTSSPVSRAARSVASVARPGAAPG